MKLNLFKDMLSNLLGSIILILLVIDLSESVATSDECQYEIVESMPEGLNLTDPNPNFRPAITHEVLIKMIDNSKNTLKIASFYWYLTADAEFNGQPATKPGKFIQAAITRAVKRGVNLEVVLDGSTRKNMNNEDDIKLLKKLGTVRYLNMTQLLKAGVLHSKFLIADNSTFYVGSSNFDWRSYSEIKEIGISFKNCPILAQDFDKIFRTYILMSEMNNVPDKLPEVLKTSINIESPLTLTMDNQDADIFLASSPPAFNGRHDQIGRTDDIDALLHIIDTARQRIGISVMNYSPKLTFGWPKRYWPLIDDALRRAATERNVKVQLLFSDWTQTRPMDLLWYKSLDALHSKLFHGEGIHVRMFKVPADDMQKKIPYSRVKHDKYMVTDNGLYIGTSNWQPDYFINTCGVSVVIRANNSTTRRDDSKNNPSTLTVIKSMQDLFDRDFQSQYAHDL